MQDIKTDQSNRPRLAMYHALTGQAEKLPVCAPEPIVSVSPVVLPTPERLVDLQLRVSFPLSGQNLPIILLSHGQGRSNYISSSTGYGPLVSFWSAHGFIVIQPTHLSSKSLNFDIQTPGAPLFWRSRAEDMKTVLDQLDIIENSVPLLKGRLDRDRVIIAGHSMGGHTASMLLGARLIDPDDGKTIVDMKEPRIKAGVLLAAPGDGDNGEGLTDFVRAHYPFFNTHSHAEMTTPTLVVAGDEDTSEHLTTKGAGWHTEPYHSSRGPKCLLTLYGAKHGLGGISGYDVAETTDESVERVAFVQRLTWAYMRSALYPDDPAWSAACSAFKDLNVYGKVECK